MEKSLFLKSLLYKPMLIGNTEADLDDTSYLLKVYGRLTHAVLCCAQFKTLFFLVEW